MSSPHPLQGRTIVVTRAAGQGRALAALLERRGARVIEFPAIRIAPPRSWKALDRACRAAGQFDWIVFTSANGVDAFCGRLRAVHRTVRALQGVKVAAVGARTAAVCRARGMQVSVVPGEFKAQALGGAFRRFDVEGRRVLHPRGDRAGPVLAQTLRRRGARVTEVIAYRTLRARPPSSAIRSLCDGRRIDVLTFASGETVRHFAAILGRRRARALAGRCATAVIGPVTAAAARKFGFDPVIRARPSTAEGLVKECERHFRAAQACEREAPCPRDPSALSEPASVGRASRRAGRRDGPSTRRPRDGAGASLRAGGLASGVLTGERDAC